MSDASDGPPSGDGTAGDAARTGAPVLSLALASLMDDLRAHAGAVYLLHPQEPVLELAVMAGLPRPFVAPWERLGLSAKVPVAQAVRERRLVWVGDGEEMARRFPRIAVVLPYAFTLAALPLATGRATYGAVFVAWPSTHPAELSERERGLLTAAGDRLARRLERAAEKGRPARPEPDLLSPAPVAAGVGTFGSLEAARMVARLPYGMCALDLDGRVGYANPAAGELLGLPVSALLGSPLWANLPWLTDPVYEDRYRAALISRRPTSFVALRPPADWLSFRLYPGADGLSVRISRAGPRARPGAERPSGADDVPLVTMTQVLGLTGALTEAASVQDVIDLVADEIGPSVGARAAVVLGSQGGRMHVLGHRGYPDARLVERFEGTPLTARTPGVRALTTGLPAFFESRAHLEQVYPEREATPDTMAAWAYLPLIASGRPVGACVLAYAEPHTFPTGERAVLTSLSGLVAQALERARLYDVKHRLAHGLQAALLPDSLPSLPGVEAAARYLPATEGMEIGGDFYDLVPTPGGAAAVIGDVEGHNVTAAALMGQLRTAVRAYTTVGQPPDGVLRGTNRLLIELGSDLFATCVHLAIDVAGGRVRMARAGHPPPLLRGPDGRVRTLEVPGGPLLGFDPDARYPATEVPFPPGSVLALYTDGLIESPGVDLDDALAALVRRLASSGDLPLEELADHLVRHSATARRRSDDVALLLLRALPGGG
ncbi:SpoIIE family protein phosphatase [Streptomyces minutiscleroticus]|uniref:SpoIIE family protein phosphatase n=1 Tax=Streptomyces minutiscleroticus TaxID=68238 RepID=UPI003571482A